MKFQFCKTCHACGNPESSAEHRSQKEKCSLIKKAQYNAYIKTAAYANEQAALKKRKAKQKKLNEVPFGPVYDKRGVPFKSSFL